MASKTRSFAHMASAASTVLGVVSEIGTHASFCASFGITAQALEEAREEAATTAYGAYLMEVGARGDELMLRVALGACLVGYGEVGLWLVREAGSGRGGVQLEGNPYRK